MSCKGTIKMKQKKQRSIESLLQPKNVVDKIIEEIIVEEEKIIDVNDGTVTDVSILDDEESVVVPTEVELKAMTKAKLVELADEIGIESVGTKTDLIEKILNV